MAPSPRLSPKIQSSSEAVGRHDYPVFVSEASQAANEVLAGAPGPAARRWLGLLALVAALLFIVNTLLVVSGVTHNASTCRWNGWCKAFGGDRSPTG